MSEPTRLRPVPKPGQPERPLESWKEIAAYLNRTVRTARRWEAEGLPVHRHPHRKRDSVFAYESELDEWWDRRRARLEPEERPEKTAGAPRRRPGRQIWVAAGLGLTVLLALATIWRMPLGRRPALSFANRDWVLIADFSNRTGDPLFDNSLSMAFTVSLQQSAHINVLPPARVIDALRRMGKDAKSRIDETLGREICLRENARALIVCDIARVGSEYALSVQLVDPQTSETVRAYFERSAGQDGILERLGKIAARIRRDLGESLSAIRGNGRPLPQVTTPSLEALRLYADGRQLWRKGAYQDAVASYRRALDQDPGFAMAHGALGSAYCSHIFSYLAEGKKHYEKALQLSGRVTERERLLLQAAYKRDLGDAAEAVRLYQVYLSSYPDDTVVRYDLGTSLMRSNRPAEAVVQLKEAVRAAPTYASAYINLATSYNLLGDSQQAVPYYAKAFELEPGWSTLGNLNHEYGFTLAHLGDVDKARAAFERVMAKPDGRVTGLRSMALLDLYQGKYHDANVRLRESIVLCDARRDWLKAARNRIYLAIVLEGEGDRAGQLRVLDQAAVNLKALSSAPAWVAARIGMGYARAGAIEKAARMLRIVRPQAGGGNREDRSCAHMLEGELAAARQDHAGGIELLTLADREASTPETVATLAGALDRAGDAAQAIVLYDRLIPMGRQSLGWEAQQAWLAAHVRLAELYAARGENGKAARPLHVFSRIWASADTDLPLARRGAALRSALDGADRPK